ncbi:MAG: cupin domain-containing protein [Verrucomicrobiales bacterium]|nr:cupin domain-containing protein [Verrucomicrobiales bacterium]
MNAERMNELAALNAVGALDAAEARAFEAALASAGPEVQAEVRRINDTAAAFAFARRAQLPAHLKSKVMGRIGQPAAAKAPNVPFYSVSRDEGQWQTLPVPGVRMKELAADPRRGTSVRLYELAPGTRFPHHRHSGPEECFVLSGDFHVEGHVLHAGDFHHAEEQTDHGESFTIEGCQLLVMARTTDYGG